MKKSAQTTYFLWADVTRVIAIFLVVLLHVAAMRLYDWGKIPVADWYIANIYDSLSRMCVPLFVMMSGALLLGKTESYTDFFKKRVRKVVIPWIAWVLISLFWQVLFHHQTISNVHDFKGAFFDMSLGGFWFLSMLVGLYLLTPLLRVFTRSAQKKEYHYLFLLWVVGQSLLPFLQWTGMLHVDVPRSILFDYLGYFLLGYYVCTFLQIKKMESKKILMFEWLLVGSWLITIGGTFFYTKTNQKFSDIFYDFLSPAVVTSAVASFIALIHASEQMEKKLGGKIKQCIHFLSRMSFGVYLIHVIILEVLLDLIYPRFPQVIHFPMLTIPVTAVLTFGASTLIVWLMKKVQFLKEIVP